MQSGPLWDDSNQGQAPGRRNGTKEKSGHHLRVVGEKGKSKHPSASSSSGKMGFCSQQWKESEKMSLGTGAFSRCHNTECT